ncbi:glucose 1-dehydrogenase [Acidovorax sp. NCPPB 3859]|nr:MULTISPECIES: glucose 1-dehydrogenase [unclassified Acidovorax]MDA8452674.1 glucose 1-dehydrogenase [Acidovorax sp. GBBC 3297]MDA8462081.1 glucose 1-dehydrogenase [Acidovorax sp. GBBC 3333]MDA8467086.1 glucose 1-dehydrogenase [Acidovorax sp. GBBC 3332]MDA8472122.1 glucose 1-dehydrogenase [Acidovorax sp. GBBC 3299]WCM80183.1 glucose 1-dehydrogenase [Acidovorax sp. GBBC 712]
MLDTNPEEAQRLWEVSIAMTGIDPGIRLQRDVHALFFPSTQRRKHMTTPPKIAVITGGTAGIGKAIAMHLASGGTHVALTGRRESEGQHAQREVQEQAADGILVRFMPGDVTREQDVEQLFAGVVSAFGRVDHVINSAGIGLETKLLADSSSEAFREMLDVNVMGVYYSMKHALKQMLIQQGGGSIVNVASAAGLNGMASVGPYAATKHAVVGLTKTAALEYATQGIRVNAVAPGTILTERLAARLQASGTDEKAIGLMHPMQRLGTPQEVAEAVGWLLSDAASFVTGHILSVDGGLQAK